MLVFHPQIYAPSYSEQKQELTDRANNGEIRLLLECEAYLGTLDPIQGFESMETYPTSLLCSAYQMAQVPFRYLSDGGSHSIAMMVFFFCSAIYFPEMKKYTEMFSEEVWYDAYLFFLEDIKFDINDYSNCSENMKIHIHERADLFGGFPANIPYDFFRDCSSFTLQALFPYEPVEDTITRKIIIEREQCMATHIRHAVENNTDNKDIHVCIGAGHVMPRLTDEQMEKLSLDDHFKKYHASIKEPRLLELLSDIEHKIEIYEEVTSCLENS